MLAVIELDYDATDKIKALDREAFNKFATAMSQLNIEQWQEGEKQPSFYLYSQRFLIDLSTDGQILFHYGLDFKIKNFKNTYKAASIESNGNTYNLHVHVPNIGLLAIDEVKVVEDSCTDSLQRDLDEGWRIVAVCPPNGVRRPDYIMGRTKK
jgi:hypothetical protein